MRLCALKGYGNQMTKKEHFLKILNNILENKLISAINIIESLKSYAEDAVDPDEWDLEMTHTDDIDK